MTFSEMLCNTLKITPEQGELEGTCCICQKHTTTGFKKKFSGTFTCADYISHGEVICPECQYLVKNSNEYRRTMFLLTEDELIKFKKKEAKEIVLNLPNKPFYIYLTKTWQKIGWIRMNWMLVGVFSLIRLFFRMKLIWSLLWARIGGRELINYK